jgi:hypothetical protein
VKHGLSLVTTRRGRRLELTREVTAPASTAWTLLVDVTRWREWSPVVTGVEYAGRRLSAGTSGSVQVLWLLWLPFTVETVRGMLWTWRVRGLVAPADGHRVDAIADDRCRVALQLPPWAPWYLPVCLLALWSLARQAESEPDPDIEHGEQRRRD